jgi:hypothetical protein
MISRHLGWCLLILVSLMESALSSRTMRVQIGGPESKSYLEMKPVFSALPLSGASAMRIAVMNATQSSLAFSVLSQSRYGGWRQSDSYAYEQSLMAPAEQLSEMLLIGPILSRPDSVTYSYGRNMSYVEWSIRGGADFNHTEPMIDGSVPAIAMTDVASLSKMQTTLASTLDPGNASSARSAAAIFAKFTPKDLPADWRVLQGFQGVILSAKEWLELAPEVRLVFVQWVEMGGSLLIITAAEERLEQLQLPLTSAGDRLGLGRITLQPEQIPGPENLRFAGWVAALNKPKPQQLSNPKTIRNLQTQVGEKSFSAWQITVILIAFGLLVGPINLFYFAKPGRRHRLFFTTPIISVGASLVLIAYIFFQDGSGGVGGRVVLAYINPEKATVHLKQHQFARTGVLFSSAFDTKEAALVAPILLEDSRWTRLKQSDLNGTKQQFLQVGPSEFAGNWFQSRSEQGQEIELIRSSRGRIEISGIESGSPKVRSSLSYPLETFFYHSKLGNFWQAEGIIPVGGEVALKKVAEGSARLEIMTLGYSEFETFKEAILPNHFYAKSTDAKAEFIETLKSIRWSTATCLAWGPVVINP